MTSKYVRNTVSCTDAPNKAFSVPPTGQPTPPYCCHPIPQRVPEPPIPSIIPRAHLVIDRARKCSHLPSQTIVIPTAWQARTRHPDILAVLHENDELTSWIRGSTCHGEVFGELGTPTEPNSGPTAPASCPRALESFRNIDSFTSPLAYPAEVYHSPPRENPITNLAASIPVVQDRDQPERPAAAPHRMCYRRSWYPRLSFKGFFKRSRSYTNIQYHKCGVDWGSASCMS